MITGNLTKVGAKGLGGEIPGKVNIGIQGPPGKTPELSVGDVETLPPESPATVEISGTKEKPILNFGIPQGRQGEIANGNVAYDEEQELTEEQKAQARANIGAQPVGEYLTKVPEGYAKNEDIEKVDRKVDTLREVVSKSNIVESASGDLITVSDASDMELAGLRIFGKTTQNGTPTPDAPVSLDSVGDDGSITVKVGTSETDRNPQTLIISTPNGLPGIPVSSGGNYTDENGQQWVCDEVDFGMGVYVQRVGKIVNDGSKTGATSVLGNYTRTYFVVNANAGGSTPKAMSDFLPYLVNYTQESEHFYVAANGDLFCFLKSERLTNPNFAGVQAFFANNPQTVLYVLATPLETTLSAEELAAYAALHTNYPNTTVFNDGGAGMEVKYVADTKLYIDKKFAELSTALLNQ